MNRSKNLVKLTEQAKEGNNDAINKLIENNSKTIIKYAKLAYEELRLKYNLYYNLEEDNNLPNNIIDLDDIIQEFYIKSMQYIKTYLKTDCDYYFSSFLGNYLNKYEKLYVKKELKKIIKQNDNEEIKTIDIILYDYMEKKQKQDIINYIISIIEIDKKLMPYKLFIKDILSGLSYEELCEIYKLPKNRINMKIKDFCDIFKRHEELNKTILESMNEEYVLDKLLNEKMLEIPYYKYLFDINIEKMKNIYPNVPQEYLEDYLHRTIFKWVTKYLTNNDFNLKEFNKQLYNKFSRQYILYKKQPKQKIIVK